MNYNRSTEVRHFAKPVLCGVSACGLATVLRFKRRTNLMTAMIDCWCCKSWLRIRKMAHNGWQYGKWLITEYKPIKLHHHLSEVERYNNHEYSHLLYCVL